MQPSVQSVRQKRGPLLGVDAQPLPQVSVDHVHYQLLHCTLPNCRWNDENEVRPGKAARRRATSAGRARTSTLSAARLRRRFTV